MSVRQPIQEVTERIAVRSAERRAAYLDRLAAAREAGVNRAVLSCGNLAHGFAACSSADMLDTSASPTASGFSSAATSSSSPSICDSRRIISGVSGRRISETTRAALAARDRTSRSSIAAPTARSPRYDTAASGISVNRMNATTMRLRIAGCVRTGGMNPL